MAATLTDRLQPRFAHESEAELARILDYYGVAWRYEPDTFPISWNASGAVVESFAPDFYLPEIGLYVELTTLKQSLVRKKNRKLRRLRDLYPGLRIKLLYARDFRALLLKYGRISLADGLSGAEGQATPPRRDTAAAASRTGRPSASADALPQSVHGDDAPAGLAARSRRSRRTRAQARARAVARAASAPLTEMNA